MSFSTDKAPGEGMPPGPGGSGLPLTRRGASAPAFKPQVLRSVRMHPLLAASVAAAVLVLTLGYALTQRNMYQAISQVYEEPAAAKLLADNATGNFDANKYETFLDEQMQLVQRLDVLTTALETLPQTTWSEYGGTAQQAAENIQAQLKVVRVATSYQISISLKGPDSAKTAEVVNAITTAYLDAVHRATSEDSDERGQLLAEERQRIETELRAARAEQAALGGIIGVANPAAESGNPFDSELSGIRAQLTEARAAHDMAAAQLAALSGLGPTHNSGLTAAADEVIAGDPGLGSMKANIAQRKAQLNGQMAGMKPENPVYKQDQDEMAELDRTLDANTNELRAKAERRLQDRLRSDLERTGDVEARLNADLAHQIAAATTAAPKLQRATEVSADIQRLDVREAAVDDAMRGLRLEANGPAQVRLSLAASAPEHPEANRRRLLLMAALPLALLVGIGAAVLARKQDKRIYSGLDIEDVLGFPPMAVLPSRNDVPGRVFDEYVLRLAAAIESAYRTSGARTFLLTAVSLTTDIQPLAAALTRKLKEIGVHVVEATASDMLTPADGDAGPTRIGQSDAWSEGFVAANMARMKTEHGLVLIESQALVNCAQTEYVARCADATILMIECGVTTRNELYCAAELLQRLNVTGIGAVLEELQLRFAEADFRKAVEALERRQAQGIGQLPRAERTPKAAAEIQPAVAEVSEQPVVEPAVPMVETESEPESEVIHEAVEPIESAREPEVAEGPEEGAVASAASETPIHIQVAPEVNEVAPTGTLRRGFAGVMAAGPMLVDNDVFSARLLEEIPEEEPLIAVANGTLHEKMAPKLSARREAPGSDGEVHMTRKTSWFGRLLGRDIEPVVSIIPDDDEEAADVEPRHTSGVAERDEQTGEEYDLPLATRLEQISRQRPAAPAVLRNSRLQIVPHEVEDETADAETDVPPLADESAIALMHTRLFRPEDLAGELVIEPIEEERIEIAPWVEAVFVPAMIAAPELVVAPEPVPAAEPIAPAQVAVRAAPRRPMSFQELARQHEVAPVEASVPQAPPAETREPGVEAGLEHFEAAVEPESEEAVVEAAEPVRAPLAVVEEHAWADTAEVELERQAEARFEAEHERSSDNHPAYREAHSEVPRYSRELEFVAQGGPSRWEADANDIEPVYQDAARNLTTGRWDPIPPLRSSENGWRDRRDSDPAMGVRGYTERGRWTGTEEDVNGTPKRWVPEQTVVVSQPEPVPEPVLTRQWGLLSKFQQARISGQHAVAGADRLDSERETVPPDLARGDRQS